MKRLLLAALLSVALFVAAACSNGDGANSDTDADSAAGVAALGDGSLGFVTVPAGQPIQLRLVLVNQGEFDSAGIAAVRISQMALADYGGIGGFHPTFGEPINDPCGPDSAEVLAYTITEDPQVVGIVGPTCSSSAVAFSPVISDAGLVTITSFSEAPGLTSDLAGTPGSDYYPGFYRTSSNDIIKATAIARFIYESQGITTAATLYSDNVLTQSLAEEFEAVFGELGGMITSSIQAVTAEELSAAITELVGQAGQASEVPRAVLLALNPPLDVDVLGQAAAALNEATAEQDRPPMVLIADATVSRSFINKDTFGMFFAMTAQYDNNLNQSTEVWTDDFHARYVEEFGEAPFLAAWAQAYDATTLLLDAVAGASYVNDDGNLVIDRQGIRAWLNQVTDYQGLSGPLNCDQFGDCSSGGTIVVQHTFSDFEKSLNNVVFEHSNR